jgi:hypothetical protein
MQSGWQDAGGVMKSWEDGSGLSFPITSTNASSLSFPITSTSASFTPV